MPFKVKAGGVWKDALPRVKVSGAWKKAVKYIKVSGVWKVVSSIPWSLQGIFYTGKRFAMSDSVPEAITFKPDGTTMYVMGNSQRRIYQYTLSTPWDVSTASLTTSLDTPIYEFYAIRFSTDGTRLFAIDNGSNIRWFDLSVAWDVSTAVETDFRDLLIGMKSLYFRSDGLKLFLLDSLSDDVFEFDLTTAWDINTATATQVVFDVSPQEPDARTVYFKDDGTRMFIFGINTDSAYQYELTTPWDLTTASYSGLSFDFTNEDNNPRDIFISSDGTDLYMVGTLGVIDRSVYQYAL